MFEGMIVIINDINVFGIFFRKYFWIIYIGICLYMNKNVYLIIFICEFIGLI